MPDVKKVSVSAQECRNDRTNDIGSDVANLHDMFIRYLTKSVNMFSGCGRGDRENISNGLGEIEKLTANAGSMLVLEGELGEMENRIAISDENTMGRLMK